MDRAIKLLQKFLDDHTKKKRRLCMEWEHDYICMCELCLETRKFIKECSRFMRPSGQIGQ